MNAPDPNKAHAAAARYLAEQSKQADKLATTEEGRALLTNIQQQTRATIAAQRKALVHYQAADRRITRALRTKRFGRPL